MDNKYYPVAFLVLIGVAGFIMYSGVFTPKINLEQYKEYCLKYESAEQGEYAEKEILGLVSKINYLLPSDPAELQDPLEKEIKLCANRLSTRLKK